MTRQQANVQLAHELMRLIETHPEQRFSQILLNFRFVREEFKDPLGDDYGTLWKDEYYLEPDVLLKRVLDN